jgi:hypothetical protein
VRIVHNLRHPASVQIESRQKRHRAEAFIIMARQKKSWVDLGSGSFPSE